MKSIYRLLVVVAFVGAVGWAQCAHYPRQTVTDQTGRPVPLPTARVCQEPASGLTCTPIVNLFSDPSCTQSIPNPMTGDAQGNVDFYTNGVLTLGGGGTIPFRGHLQLNGGGITQIDVAYVPFLDNIALSNPFSLSAITPGATGSGTYDFSAATVLKAPVAAGLTTASSGSFGEDSTASNWHFWNGADSVAALMPVASLPTNGQLGIFTVSAGKVALSGQTMSQDCTMTSGGVITCTKTNNVAFSPSATTDMTNLSNATSGTVAAARGGAGTVSGALKGNGSGVVSQAGPADLSGEVDNQCIIGSSGAWGAGGCVQLSGIPPASFSLVNANTTSFQNLGNACTSTCFAAGVLNSLNKTFMAEFWGSYTPVNTSETIQLQISIGGSVQTFSAAFPSLSTNGTAFHVKVICRVTTAGSSGAALCIALADENGCGACIGPSTSNSVPVTNLLSGTFSGINLTASITPSMAIAFSSATTSNSAVLGFAYAQQWN